LGFILIGVFGLLTCTMCTGAAVSQGMAQMEEEEATQLAADQEAERRVPWLADVQETCRQYDEAPNDIQKSAVFQRNQDFIRGQQLDSVRGELDAASTGHGGGGLLLRVKVGRSNYAQVGIREGNPLYSQAANLVEGQCVVFSGRVTDTFMFGGSGGGLLDSLEKSRVCSMSYMFEFFSISPCPQS